MSRIDIGRDIRSPQTEPATPEGFYRYADDPLTGTICAELADLMEQYLRGELAKEEYGVAKRAKKIALHFYTPHAHFGKGYKDGNSDPQDSGKALIDLDGCENFRELYTQHLMGREQELGIDMVNVSASGSGGHVLFDIPEGLSRQQAQAWMASQMGGVAYDKAVHELERGIYIPCREYILYIDEARMFGDELKPAVLSQEEIRKWQEQDKGRTQGQNCGNLSLQNGPSSCTTVAEADKRTLYIFDACMQEAGLRPQDLIEEGARHNSLKCILSVGATQLLTQEELNGVLKVRMSQNWQDQNIRQLVSDFYSKYTDPSQKMTQFQRRMFAMSRRLVSFSPADGAASAEDSAQADAPTDMTPLSLLYSSNMPPEMPQTLPKLIKLLTKNTPDIYKPTVAHAVFPALGVHLHEVKFRYTDNRLHEATLMNIAMAETGSGKGCIDDPINHVMADIRERDKENEQRLKDFNDANNRKGANKDKLERPKDLVIQEINIDVTHAALVQRLDEAQKRFLYLKLNEVELFDKLKGTGGQQFVLMCQAFDPDNRYGQTRAGSQSVNATVQVRWNWNTCGTIKAVQDYFKRQLTKGPISRINFCTIPEREIGSEQPVYGIYDEQFDEQLRPYLNHLKEAHGIVKCPQALKLAKELIAECAEFSRLSQDRVFENLSFRANVIAWLKANVLYVANGCRWEKAIEDFIRWSLRYDLYCKFRYFGDGIRKEMGGAQITKRGPRNLLALLPDEFTFEDAVRVRQQNDKDREGTGNMLNQWVYRNYVLRITNYSFKKVSNQ